MILAFVAIVLGWAALKTRDLAGSLALVKWFLLLALIAVTSLLIPLLLAGLLWDRKEKSAGTPYRIQVRPGRLLSERPNFTGIESAPSSFRLLFPDGSPETPPPESFIEAWDSGPGKLLPPDTDGIPYYTEDPAALSRRNELFRELYGKPETAEILRQFAARYPVRDDSGSDSLLSALIRCRERHEAVRFLRGSLLQADLSCAALRELRDELNRLADSDAGRKAEEAFVQIPGELYEIRSLTLAVNLDGAGYAHEAGILALHSEPFDAGTAEPLIRPDRERYDLTLSLNRELMGAVDRILADELRRCRVDLEALRQTELSDALAGELRFAAAFAALVDELAACGMEGSGEGDLFGQVCSMGEAAVKAVLRNRMGYETELHPPEQRKSPGH